MFDHDNRTTPAGTAPADSVRTRLADQLRERLTVAAEFATLGAYELLEREEARASRHQATPEPTKRVFLFARVPEVRCAHSPAAVSDCTARAKARVLAGGGPPAHHGQAARRARRHLPRRGGAVTVLEQPCVWSAPGEAGADRG